MKSRFLSTSPESLAAGLRRSTVQEVSMYTVKTPSNSSGKESGGSLAHEPSRKSQPNQELGKGQVSRNSVLTPDPWPEMYLKLKVTRSLTPKRSKGGREETAHVQDAHAWMEVARMIWREMAAETTPLSLTLGTGPPSPCFFLSPSLTSLPQTPDHWLSVKYEA